MDYTKGPIYVDSPSLTGVVLWSWVLQLRDLGKLRIVSVKIKLNYLTSGMLENCWKKDFTLELENDK